jgi:polar amino acid transport system substrate-binding protein
MSRTTLIAAAVLAVLLGFRGTAAMAQTCGQDYTVQDGDSLAKIATKAYGKSSQWTTIFYANQDRMGGGQSLLVPGLALRIPCVGGQTAKLPEVATTEAQAPAAPTPPPLSSEVKRIQFLTATDFSPFTDQSLPGGGMVTDIVNTAMTKFKKDTNATFDYNIVWVNDWAAHLNPLLVTRAFDMGFPWYKPDCASFEDLDSNAKFRCQKFFFSAPLFEEQVLVFVRKDSKITLENENELVGKKLCRQAGVWTFDLDEKGRNWVKDNKVTLMRPQGTEDCFKLLARGEVDAVPINELTGRTDVLRLDLGNEIKTIEKPLSFITMHVVIAKTHPQARAMLYYLNTALDGLRASGEYDKIVERHLQQFWDSQAEQAQKPTAAKTSEKPADDKPADAKETATASATKTDTKGTAKK